MDFRWQHVIWVQWELGLLSGKGAQTSAGMAILLSHQRPVEIIAR